MRISVVILNWNRPDDTVAAVTSVLAQDYADVEILVWDNASSDDSRERLTAAFGREARVRLEWGDGNYGVAGGRNRAFARATGEILLSLDSDAVIENADAVSRMAEVFRAEQDVGALSFEVRRPDGHLMWPFARPAAQWRERRFDAIRVDGCSFATRRALFEQLGGFAEHFSPYGAEDQYYAFQVIGAGYRVVYLPAVKVIHAFAPTGRQGRQFTMHVRNMLWMPMELFPLPEAAARAGAQALYLAREAREQRQFRAYLAGLGQAVTGFRAARRKPMSRDGWRRLRALVAEDKAAATAASPPAPRSAIT